MLALALCDAGSELRGADTRRRRPPRLQLEQRRETLILGPEASGSLELDAEELELSSSLLEEPLLSSSEDVSSLSDAVEETEFMLADECRLPTPARALLAQQIEAARVPRKIAG